MDDHSVRSAVPSAETSTTTVTPPSASHSWAFLLPLVWLALGARIVVALVRRESIRDDFLSLALVAFLMTSAVLGSRVWLWFHEHLGALHHARGGGLRAR